MRLANEHLKNDPKKKKNVETYAKYYKRTVSIAAEKLRKNY